MKMSLYFFLSFVSLFLFSSCSVYNGDLKLHVHDAANRTLVVNSNSTVGPKESYKTVVVLSGSLDFAGSTEELVLVSGSLRLRAGSRVDNSLVILSGNLQKDDGAFIQGDEIHFRAPDYIPAPLLALAPYIGFAATGVALLVSTIFWILLNWISGVFAYYTMPKYMADIETKFREEKPRNFFAAVLAILFTVPSILLLVISIIGILLLPFYGIFYSLFLGTAYIVFASMLGQWLPSKSGKKYSHLRLLLGLTVISVAGIFLPTLTHTIVAFGMMFAWGAVLRVSYRRVFPCKKIAD